jgi:hypothetical protein
VLYTLNLPSSDHFTEPTASLCQWNRFGLKLSALSVIILSPF